MFQRQFGCRPRLKKDKYRLKVGSNGVVVDPTLDAVATVLVAANAADGMEVRVAQDIYMTGL